MELEITPISATVTGSAAQMISSAGKNVGTLFDFDVKPNDDTFVIDNDDVTIKIHNENTGNTVSKTTRGSKLIAKSVSNNNWRGYVAYDREGNLRTLDYHEPNKEHNYNVKSISLEIKGNEYTLKYRDNDERTVSTKRGNTTDLNLEALGLDTYLDAILNAE